MNGKTTVVGVVSWGEKCADRRFPGVYARVTSAMSFIKKQLKQSCGGSVDIRNCGRKPSTFL